ncbi:MAG: hypothetical protein M5T61_09835 [Acidimicrobiia bacterium]|nr:hypothetical protein [Acidimicrobiia bacterium]
MDRYGQSRDEQAGLELDVEADQTSETEKIVFYLGWDEGRGVAQGR